MSKLDSWKDVQWLIADLDRDGYTVESVRTNANPVSGEKRVIIDIEKDE